MILQWLLTRGAREVRSGPRRRLYLGLGLLALVGSVACREQPTTPAAAPAAVPPAAGEPAVSPKEPPQETEAPPSPSRVQVPSGRAETEADGRDDPHAPDCLPRSRDGGPWIQAEPIRVVDNTRLGELLTKPEAARLIHFRLISAARGAYLIETGSSPPGQIRVLLLETESPDDAYGLLTCQSASAETLVIGGETRVDREGAPHLHCWQGRWYVRLWTVATAPASEPDMVRLLRRIVERLPAADPPAILQVWPEDSFERLYLVRHLAALPPDPLIPLSASELRTVSDLLGLGPEALMAVAIYRQPGARRANVVWLARYPDAKFAEIGHSRYAKRLAQSVGRVWETTQLMPPQGRCVLGTWTIDEESLQHRLLEAADRLQSLGL